MYKAYYLGSNYEIMEYATFYADNIAEAFKKADEIYVRNAWAFDYKEVAIEKL